MTVGLPSQALRASSPKGGAKSLSLWERWHCVSNDGEGKAVDHKPEH